MLDDDFQHPPYNGRGGQLLHKSIWLDDVKLYTGWAIGYCPAQDMGVIMRGNQ